VEQSPWMDMTVRVASQVEVELQPDSTVELSWPIAETSRFTLLLSPAEATELHRLLGLKLLVVEQ